MKFIPNLLSSGRLVLTLFMFLALAAVGGGVPFLRLGADSHQALMNFAFWAFVIAAVTDFFDGWLARKLDAVTVWGAILDPIGDKVLVCGAILGLLDLDTEAPVETAAHVLARARAAVEVVGEGEQRPEITPQPVVAGDRVDEAGVGIREPQDPGAFAEDFRIPDQPVGVERPEEEIGLEGGVGGASPQRPDPVRVFAFAARGW